MEEEQEDVSRPSSAETSAEVLEIPWTRKRGRSQELKRDLMMICADDDPMMRIGYRGVVKVLERVKESKILGATYTEASSLVTTVLGAAEVYGDENVVCVFDLHMDTYPGEEEVLGSDVISALRTAGFQGVAIIRSGNEDDHSKKMCHEAGADAVLNKRINYKQIADAVMIACRIRAERHIMSSRHQNEVTGNTQKKPP